MDLQHLRNRLPQVDGAEGKDGKRHRDGAREEAHSEAMALLSALGHLANFGQFVEIGQGHAHQREQIRWSRRGYTLDAEADGQGIGRVHAKGFVLSERARFCLLYGFSTAPS